ncbi:hypothetical protein GCM10007867_05700 [Gluconobacter cerinus]|uniref:Uncharacterized protein n=1 Tax=Gluconobacter cerinus TaxID=38307 RepID=A0AAV5NCH8_9PROT|nr:hypothetical protein GCM10007867_05700 [Gluconobacter cerinus]
MKNATARHMTRFSPNFMAIQAEMGEIATDARRYAVTPIERSSVFTPKERAIVGREVLMMAPSRFCMNVAIAMVKAISGE